VPPDQTTDPTPIPIFNFPNEFGFQIVVEARKGTDGQFPASCGVFAPAGGNTDVLNPPCAADGRAAVQILADRPLGNGSTEVCDISPPNDIGGVPAVQSLIFDGSQTVTDTIDDFACRFELHPSTDVACTLNDMNNFSFISNPVDFDYREVRQYCTFPVVGKEIAFQHGITRLKVQVEDNAGNVGNQVEIAVRVP
jgi:hypothetical protein